MPVSTTFAVWAVLTLLILLENFMRRRDIGLGNRPEESPELHPVGMMVQAWRGPERPVGSST